MLRMAKDDRIHLHVWRDSILFTYMPLSNVIQLKQNGFTEMKNGHDSKVYDQILHFIMSQQSFGSLCASSKFRFELLRLVSGSI